MRRPCLPRVAATNAAVLLAVLGVPHAQAGRPAGVPRVVTAAASGGLCAVPGIGDIGGLLGFCSLGSSGLIGDLNNICQPSLPEPEPAGSGIDAMVAPPASGRQPRTLYDQYGVAGAFWAATNLQCSDMTSLIGNDVAGMVFDVAKSVDRVTITVYQSAAGEGILGWLQRVTDRLIASLGQAIYFPYLALVVVLGALWLAWQGLIRKRGTLSVEGAIWMVLACAAAIVLIGRPAAVTGLGRGVSDGMSQALNAAFARLPSPGPSSCVPLGASDPQSAPSAYSYTAGSTVIDQNAGELWTVLVCKPWLDGEFGTSYYAPPGSRARTAVNTYGRALLWAQAIAANEKPTQALIQAKQAAYAGIASSIQAHDPAAYPLFQGKQWTTRLEIALAALFAAVVAGVLVLLISVTLILLKLGFLLLLVAGPVFLLVGTHPGFGRVVALRWLELLIGVLLKQAAVAVVLSVLLYCYALIMGTSDAVLPWALKILMIALVTVAAFIYRKPFTHLFSAVGQGVLGSGQAPAELARAGASARARTVTAASVAVPPFAAYRVARWARRNPAQAAGVAAGLAGTRVATTAAMAGAPGGPAAAGPPPAGRDLAGHAPVSPDAAEASQRAPAAAGRAATGSRPDLGESPAAATTGPPPLKLRARSAAAAGSPRTPAVSGTGHGAGGGGWPAVRPAPAPSAVPGSAVPGRAAPSREAARAGFPARRPDLWHGASAGWARTRGGSPGPVRARAGSPGPMRARPAAARESGRDGPPSWLGRPMAGPLAGADPVPAQEQSAPFWLRPLRRK